ncbi:hypothetical protein WAF17_08705 [Bernardetia sp. ABR2-2B]|uniref:hypothetical protein n=1 Tax=Bernardetia sp. ABR2-2B TaxID=3127472 RepID=UPI0030D46C11
MNLTNRSKKLIKIAAIFIFSYFVVREIIPADFYYYKTNYSYNTNVSSHHNSKTSKAIFETDTVDILDIEQDIYFRFYDSHQNSVEKDTNTIKIYIRKDIDTDWSRFAPLFKSIDFESHNSYRWNCKIYKDSKVTRLDEYGSVDVMGKININGFCSAKKSSKMIDNIVTNEIRKAVKEKIDAKFEELLSEN